MQGNMSAPAARKPLATLNGARPELGSGGSAAKRARTTVSPAPAASPAAVSPAHAWSGSDDDYLDFVD